MEVEKMEIDVKPVHVKVETDEASEQKMDVGIKTEIVEEDSHKNETKPAIVDEAKPEIVDGDDTKDIKGDEVFIELIPKQPGLAYLKFDGMVADEGATTEGEENLTLTAEEAREYIEQAVLFRMGRKNPLVYLNMRAEEVEAEMRERRNEFQKIAKLVDFLEREQLKFLSTDKTLRRYLTKTGGVGVDLPVLPNALNAATNEAFLKKGFSPQPTQFSKPTPARTTTTTPTSAPPSYNAFVAQKANANTSKELASKFQKSTPKPEGDIECIDLTDENEASSSNILKVKTGLPALVKHPAPLPPKPFAASDKAWLPAPPKPRLKVSAEERGIVLQWDMIPSGIVYAKLSSFDIFGYHEQKHLPINTLLWKKIGTVNAMTLPMACTLTQFIEGNTYHFSIRAVDVHNRCGGYSDPISIVYKQTKS